MRPYSVFIRALLVSAVVIATSTTAMGNEALSQEELSELQESAQASASSPESSNVLPAREILLSNDEIETNSFYDRFHLSRKGRVEYRQQFQAGGKDVSLKLFGPVVKKRPGLGVSILGLSVGEHPIVVEGYGNTRKQAIRFTVEF